MQSIHLDDENVIRHIFDRQKRDPNRPRYNWAEIEERIRRGEIIIPEWMIADFPPAAPVPAAPAAPVPAAPAAPVPAAPAAPVPAAPAAPGTGAGSSN